MSNSISKVGAKKQQQEFEKICKKIKVEVSMETAVDLIVQYKAHCTHGTKRPNIHGRNSAIIAPVSRQLIPMLEEIACIELSVVLPELSRRQKCRAKRVERNIEKMKRNIVNTIGEIRQVHERIGKALSTVEDVIIKAPERNVA